MGDSFSMDTTVQVMTHSLGWTRRDGASLCHATLTCTQWKAHALLISRNLHVMFFGPQLSACNCNHGRQHRRMRVLPAFSVYSYHFIHVSLCLFSSFCHSPLSLYYVCHLVLSTAADEILTSFSFKTFIVVTLNKKECGTSGRVASSRPREGISK